MSTERTLNAIYRRDKDRMVNEIRGILFREFQWCVKSFQLRKEYAEEIFLNSIIILNNKYRILVEENYIKSQKCLYQIIMREMKRFCQEKLKDKMSRQGNYEKYRLKYNELQRKRNRKEYHRKYAKKIYYSVKKDPTKYPNYIYNRNKSIEKRKENGKQKEYNRKWYLKNKERLKIKHHNYYLTHIKSNVKTN